MKSGKLRGLAVSTAKRSPAMPDIPTAAESGVPGFESSMWYGVLVPSGVPKDIVQRLNAAIGKVLNMTDVKKTLAGQGLDAMPTAPDVFNAYLRSERDKWVKVIKASDTKAE